MDGNLVALGGTTPLRQLPRRRLRRPMRQPSASARDVERRRAVPAARGQARLVAEETQTRRALAGTLVEPNPT